MIQVARHPRNGKQIRVLTTDGCVWRNAKTLVWLQGTEESAAWNRYDVGVSTVEAYYSLSIPIDICILLGDEEKAKEWIITAEYKKVRMFAITKSLMAYIGPDTLKSMKIPNMLCLEDAIEIYPILETVWDGSEQDARALISLLLQYKRTLPIEGAVAHDGPAALHGLSLQPTLSKPQPLYFITQYYVPPKKRRATEIDTCLKQNVECKYIDKIILLNEKVYTLPVESDKIEQHVIGERLNFKHVFKYIIESVPRDCLVAIANSDIYLDDSWRTLWSVDMKDTFLSLLRWDQPDDLSAEPELFGPRNDSQDTWVLNSNSVKDRVWNWTDMDIRFGQNGCDNVVNMEMLKQKFAVSNPCMSLITHHLHNSSYRTYEMTDIIYRPTIVYLNPAGIHDLKPEYVLPGTPGEVLRDSEFCPVGHTETFKTMIAKKHAEFKDGIYMGSREFPIYTYENMKQTKDGLLHTYNSILIGKSDVVSDLWSETEMSVLAPCVKVDVALVAFCPDEVAQNPWSYMAKYLGKILYLLKKFGAGEFLGNDTEQTRGALQLFSWNSAEVPVLCRDTGFQAFCRKAHVWYPQKGLKDLPTHVEIEALRKNIVSTWKQVAEERIVFVVDNAWITPGFVRVLEKGLPEYNCCLVSNSDPVSTVAELLNGATGLVSLSGSPVLQGAWLLTPKSFVFEIQLASEPSIDIQQFCWVSRVLHNIHTIPMPRPQAAKDLENLGIGITRYVRALSAPIERPVLKPCNTITMPVASTTGFFAHAGDSFREMVQLWREKGYVEIKEIQGVQQVWLGDVGDVLLYDRPTMEWAHASKEISWKRGLFGNPTPRTQNSVPWSFWPRRPRLVEKIVEESVRISYDKRKNLLVFYGRSENAIQMRNRSKADWSTVCSDYVHLKSVHEKYPYTQEEYLKKLQGAKYGLCLAGYGKKCHREIECMAMGCVPVVAPEVDMDSYAVPLKEGVHYLRVSKPADVPALLAGVSEETWEKMSAAGHQWWKENASAEGLWELTKRLAYSASASASESA